jgi:hypothetical protein
VGETADRAELKQEKSMLWRFSAKTAILTYFRQKIAIFW